MKAEDVKLSSTDRVAESICVVDIDSEGELLYVPSSDCDSDEEEDVDGDMAGDSLLDSDEEALKDG